MIDALVDALGHAAVEAATAVVPVAVVAFAFLAFDRRSRARVRSSIIGIVLAYIGLTAFLAGVELAFLPAGERVAASFSGTAMWLLVPIGFLLGAVATIAEPAVRVMRVQVERVSAGSIDGRLLLAAISLGVGAVVATAMLRVIVDFPLWWILLPGYLLIFAIAPFADRQFVGMAFDSGGIATGPMAVTFILSLAIGAAQNLPGRDPATLAFGMIALIAMAPILTVLILGVVYRRAALSTQEQISR
jgi:hypothetical protein